jgi:predicted lipoprotein with Yx(FWY)xxD motif
MSDIKDIMGMSRGGPATEKHEKPKEQKLVKPKGMSRYGFDRFICSLLTISAL